MTDSLARVYIVSWSTLLAAALFLSLLRRNSMELFTRGYAGFIFQPWKIVTFLISYAALMLAAPHSGDITWDYMNTTFISILTFTGSPWVTGVMYRTIRREIPIYKSYIALCLWLFSANWSYDLYFYIRYQRYPDTWLINIALSGIVYFAAGIFWNIAYNKKRGAYFAFTEQDWPAGDADKKNYLKMLVLGWPFALLFLLLIALFILDQQFQLL